MNIATLLKESGLDKAANIVNNKISLKLRMEAAYKSYNFIEPATFDKFNKELKERTLKAYQCTACNGSGIIAKLFIVRHVCYSCLGNGYIELRFEKLVFIPLNEYEEIPPMDCLLDLKKAVSFSVNEMRIFDSFEVGIIREEIQKPDPVVFGIIDGCVDKFCITQWDDDISFEEIMDVKGK